MENNFNVKKEMKALCTLYEAQGGPPPALFCLFEGGPPCAAYMMHRAVRPARRFAI